MSLEPVNSPTSEPSGAAGPGLPTPSPSSPKSESAFAARSDGARTPLVE